jgi:hypothetical protein
MAVLIAPPTLGDLLKYELNGNFTRETVTLKSGTDYRRKGPSLLVAENRRARTGKRGGFAKASVSAMRTGRGLATVPIFILVPQVTIKKRLDVDGAANKWISTLPGLVVKNWG